MLKNQTDTPEKTEYRLGAAFSHRPPPFSTLWSHPLAAISPRTKDWRPKLTPSMPAVTRKDAVRFLQLTCFDIHPVVSAETQTQRGRLSGVLTSENCMECTCIRHTELPNTSKLFADFVYRFDRV